MSVTLDKRGIAITVGATVAVLDWQPDDSYEVGFMTVMQVDDDWVRISDGVHQTWGVRPHEVSVVILPEP